jgi:hypothetical protein
MALPIFECGHGNVLVAYKVSEACVVRLPDASPNGQPRSNASVHLTAKLRKKAATGTHKVQKTSHKGIKMNFKVAPLHTYLHV